MSPCPGLSAVLCPCSRPCQLPFPATVPPHSPVPSQASVVSGPLHSVSLPLPLPVALAALPPLPPLAASPSPQLGPDALAIVERAQQMVEILTEENQALQQELETHGDSSEKLHKVLPGGAGGGRVGHSRLTLALPGSKVPSSTLRLPPECRLQPRWPQSCPQLRLREAAFLRGAAGAQLSPGLGALSPVACQEVAPLSGASVP